MLQPKYMTYDGHHLSTKNKLQKAVQNYLIHLDRTLIEKNELDFIKKQIVSDIENLNKQHSRCKPLTPHWWCHQGDWILGAVGFSNFSIYKISKTILCKSQKK